MLLGICEKVAAAEGRGTGGRRRDAEAADAGFPAAHPRPRRLPPTQLAPRLFEAARGLLAGQPEGERYRLIGVGTSDLRPGAEADASDLVEGDRTKEKAREKAIERLREKFGRGAVVRGLAFRGKVKSGSRLS